MRSPLGWNRLVNELEKLQLEWEGKIGQSVVQGPGWVQGVAAGILMGRNKIAEESPMSLNKLNALLDDWERIGKTEPASTVAESQGVLDGIDYGIHLVIELVRRNLDLPRRKPPASAKNRNARQNDKAKRRSRA